MGHLISSKSSIVALIDRLNRNPVGLVDSSIIRKILSILFTDKEALIASKFPLEESTIQELTRTMKMNENELLPILESMSQKGLIMDIPYRGTTFYLLIPGLIGFIEFTFMRSNRNLPMKKLAKLTIDYLQENGKDGMAREFFGSKNQMTRALVYKNRIPTSSQISSYEDAEQIIKNASYWAVTMCYCRHMKEHVNTPCKKKAPVDGICMVLGGAARFLVRRKFATETTKEVLLEVLKTAKKYNLTHVTDNIRNKPSFICNCCHCCCELMHGIQMGYEEGIAKTPFIATIDPDKCEFCGKCVEACNVNCVGVAKGVEFKNRADRYAEVDPKVCLGCGACIPSCEKEAIKLIDRPNPIMPPENRKELFTRILKEKKRYMPFLFSRVKKNIRSFLKLN